MKYTLSALALSVAILATAPASALSINLGGGPLISSGGSGSTSGQPIVHVGIGDNNGGNSGSVVNLDIGGNGSGGTVVQADLFGGSGSGDNGGLLGGTGDPLDLGGTGGILGGGDLGNLDLLPVTADINLGLDLFGNSGTDGSGGNGGNGGNGGAGGSGGSGNGLLTASLNGAGPTCLDPSWTQIQALLNRHNYNSATIKSWTGVSGLQIVQVPICTDGKARVAAQIDANVRALQNFLASRPQVGSYLRASGYSASDVIAADRKGGKLVVYVM